ncbi:MAG TPA: signal peptide peptidase SppA, partial [Elusimicrobia bacterium]|nr:signal peptide peptidase SppA [Elusimicrobiota bacterium]
MKGKIAIIPIKGTIVSESGFIFPIPLPIKIGGTVSTEVIEFLEEVEKNKKIKAVILEIDSPGGTPYPCKEIATKVKNFSKPVIAWVKESATSGAYWIASGCKKIIADQLSIIGSIGVTSLRPDFTELLKKFGIDIDT